MKVRPGFKKKRRRRKESAPSRLPRDICGDILQRLVDDVERTIICESVINDLICEIESKESVSYQKLRRAIVRKHISDSETETQSSSESSDDSSKENTDDNGNRSNEENNVDYEENITQSYHILDIEALQESLQRIANCKTCGSSIQLTEVPNARQGLGTKFMFSCTNADCSTVPASFNSTPKHGQQYAINTQLVLAARSRGMGRSGAAKLCSILNLPTPLHYNAWTARTRKLEDVSIDVRDNSCKRARDEAAEHAKIIDPSSVNSDGSVNVATGVDGSWEHRGWESNQGLVAVIAILIAKVMDVHHMVSSCSHCDKLKVGRETGKLSQLLYLSKVVSHSDNCRFNHDGSPQSMETAGTTEIYKRSAKEGVVRYNPFVGDGDSSAFTRVSELKPYGPDVILRKDECHVHVIRRMGRALRKVKAAEKNKGKLKGFTNSIVQTVMNFYGLAIRENKGDASKMSKAVGAILSHYKVNPDHSLCPLGPDSWCSFQRDIAKGTNLHLPIKNPLSMTVVEELAPIFEKLGSETFLKGVENVSTQNANESLNALVWSMARKEQYNSASETELAINLAVGIYNDGFEATMEAMLAACGINVSPFMKRCFGNIDKERVRKSLIKGTEQSRQQRKTLRRLKHQRNAAFIRVEGVQYQSSSFYQSDLQAPPKSTKKRRQNPVCRKCGSNTHKRSNSKVCPFNKKTKNDE